MLVSAPLLAAVQSAVQSAVAASGVQPQIIVSGAESAPPGTLAFNALFDAAPLVIGADTSADDDAFWLNSSGSTGRPKGTVHSHANLYWTTELYAKPILGLREDDVLFSAAKLFFAYGLGNALSFPLSVGATTVLMAERPTPQAVFKHWTEHHVSVFFGAPTGYSGMLAAADYLSNRPGEMNVGTEAFQAFVKERLAPHKYPRLIEFVDELPKTATGKIQRFQLRELERGRG